MASPGVPRTSPGQPRISPGASRLSPGTLRTSPATSQSNVMLLQNSPIMSQNSHIVSQSSHAMLTCPTYSASGSPAQNANIALQRVSTLQPNTSPGSTRSIPAITCASGVIPITSPNTSVLQTNPAVSRTSPVISKVNPMPSIIPVNKSDKQLSGMSRNKLRTVFGISNSEVEVMPVSVGGKFPLCEPHPQTYLKLVDDHQQQQEASLLLSAVKGIRRDSASADVEVLSTHGPSHFHHSRVPHEDPKRLLHSQSYDGEMKQNTYSTSDLTDLSSVQKQTSTMKPALLRRHSDNLDMHQANSMMHHLMYPSAHTNPAISIHSTSSSSTEQQKSASHYSFAQPQCSPTQYPTPVQSMRRNSESSCTERSRDYQQAVAMNMQQHHYPQHVNPTAPIMRSLGPDKATIFPIPAPMSTVIRPYKPPTPPPSSRNILEQYQNENFYRSNLPFFERIRENIQQSFDTRIGSLDRGGHVGQKRPQPASQTVEKPLHPQTFAPRVLVRESIPETPAHMPPPNFSSPHYANANQHLSGVMPNHHGHYSNNMHSNSAIHHMTQAGLHPNNQVPSSVIANAATTQRNKSSSGSGTGEKRQCLNCPQPARFLCSGCKKAWYCSEQCQRDHWGVHNTACVP